MTEYGASEALQELVEIGTKLLSKAERDLKNRKITEVARIYALVKRESEKTEIEARKLRLAGDLDSDVYRQLGEGYDSLGSGIMELAKAYKVAGDVAVLSKCLKHSVDRDWSSIAEYARMEGEK